MLRGLAGCDHGAHVSSVNSARSSRCSSLRDFDCGSSRARTSRQDPLAMPCRRAKLGPCPQPSRSERVLSRKPSSWFEAFRHRRPGMTSCIASTCGRRLMPDSQISELVGCIPTRQFGRNLRREDRLVRRSPAIASRDSSLHRAGFGVLRCAHGRSDRRPRRTSRGCPGSGTSCARVSRRAVEGGSRISLSHHLPIFGRRVLGRHHRALQRATREEEANSQAAFCFAVARSGTPVEQARPE